MGDSSVSEVDFAGFAAAAPWSLPSLLLAELLDRRWVLAVGSGAAGCAAPDEDATDEALLLEDAVDALRWTPAAATLAELV